jgi:thioredoxin-related protein
MYTLLVLGFIFFSNALFAEIKIAKVMNFQVLAKQMQQKNTVLVLEFSTKNCNFCKQLEAEVLQPMLLSGDYQDLVVIRKVRLDSKAPLTYFDGSKISGKSLGRKMNIIVTPTLVFLNAQGKEVSERIVGINTPEMFSAYVDAAIEEARQSLPVAMQ